MDKLAQKTPNTAAIQILNCRWLATVDDQDRLLENAGVVIADDVVVEISDIATAIATHPDADVVDLGEHLVLPGLINAHGHAAMSLLRGYADDLPLDAWLNDHIWPAEAQLVSAAFVKDGSLAAIAEMIASGTSCFADMYFFPRAAASAVQASGIRAFLAPPVFDFPSNWATGPEQYLSAIKALHHEVTDPLITLAIGPHSPYTVSDDTYREILLAQQELQCPLQIHVHETAKEVADSIEATGMRPLARLHKLGVLNPNVQLVHMTQIDANDIEILQTTGASVVHCPRSNLKLASGFCPIAELIEAGVNVALGTDGAASNNALDMFSEMQYAALLAKAVSKDAAVVSATQALRLATINGAKALGLDETIGSIEVGKQADIAAVKFDDAAQHPSSNPISTLVYTQSGHKVSDLWVAGRRLLKGRQHTSLDINQVKANTQTWADQLK